MDTGSGVGERMNVLVVDDHAIVREALRGVVTAVASEATIVEAATGRQAVELANTTAGLELILLDLNLPDADGFTLLTQFRERHPAVSVVVLSGACDRGNILRALDGGALGFIPKSAARDVMINALRLVVAGGVYVPPEALAPSGAAHTARTPLSPAELGLTQRQVDVLALMMQGQSNKRISRALNLAEPTVKNHITAIFKALKVSNRTEAVVAVGELGWKLPQAGGRA